MQNQPAACIGFVNIKQNAFWEIKLHVSRVLLDDYITINIQFFMRSATGILSKNLLVISSYFFHIGKVLHSRALSHFFASHERHATGAISPSVSRRISPTTYSGGSLLSIYPPPFP